MSLPDTFGVTCPELFNAPGLAGELKFIVGEGKSNPTPAALGPSLAAGEEQINDEGISLHLRPLLAARAVWFGARRPKAPQEGTKRSGGKVLHGQGGLGGEKSRETSFG